MGVKHYVELPDGRRWMVVAEIEEIGNFTIKREHPFRAGIDTHAQVVVPIEAIYEMSDEQIGRQVRVLTNDARACLAAHHAEHVIHGKADLYRRWPEFIQYVEKVKPLLIEFQDHEACLDAAHALHIIELFEKHVARKQKGQVAKRYERKKTAKDYDTLFVAIGRRDGFKCAACGSVENLQIDHIEPIALGGETRTENLQLLCPPCNMKKGERTIDYRGTEQKDSVN